MDSWPRCHTLLCHEAARLVQSSWSSLKRMAGQSQDSYCFHIHELVPFPGWSTAGPSCFHSINIPRSPVCVELYAEGPDTREGRGQFSNHLQSSRHRDIETSNEWYKATVASACTVHQHATLISSFICGFHFFLIVVDLNTLAQ